jgi:hypothetical protein
VTESEEPTWRALARAAAGSAGPAVVWLSLIAGLNADLPGLYGSASGYAVALALAVWATATSEPIGTAALLLWSGTVCYLGVFKPGEAHKRQYVERRRAARRKAADPAVRKGQGR